MTNRTADRRRRSLLLAGPGNLVWREEALPAVGEGAVLVETTAGAISVGSELPLYRGYARSSQPASYPRMTGYESLGIVRYVGARVSDLAPGDRVVAFYGHRTAAVLPRERVIPVPSAVSDRLALLVVLGCDADKGLRALAPQPDEAALLTGAGTMGLLSLWLLRARGLAQVDLVEPLPSRRELARLLGATQAWSPEVVPGQPEYAVGVECSSRDAAFALLQSRMRSGGRICVLADGNREPLTLAPEFHARELRLFGSSDGWDYAAFARWYFAAVVLAGGAGLERLFELEIEAAALPETFARLARGEIAPVKVLVRYR